MMQLKCRKELRKGFRICVTNATEHLKQREAAHVAGKYLNVLESATVDHRRGTRLRLFDRGLSLWRLGGSGWSAGVFFEPGSPISLADAILTADTAPELLDGVDQHFALYYAERIAGKCLEILESRSLAIAKPIDGFVVSKLSRLTLRTKQSPALPPRALLKSNWSVTKTRRLTYFEELSRDAF
jgi:hypothetical protein